MFTGAVGAFTRSLHCNTLLHAAARCPTLERNAIYCNTCVPTGHDTCNTLQNTSTHCHTLPHTAIQCNTMQYMCTNRIWHMRTPYLPMLLGHSRGAHTAAHCNTLQYTHTYRTFTDAIGAFTSEQQLAAHCSCHWWGFTRVSLGDLLFWVCLRLRCCFVCFTLCVCGWGASTRVSLGDVYVWFCLRTRFCCVSVTHCAYRWSVST